MRDCFDLLGGHLLPTLRYVCSDMWQPYLDVIAEQAKGAIHILDRFHIMATMNKAIDEVQAGEARWLKVDGYEPVLKHSRWCLLKRPENRTQKQTVKLQDRLKIDPPWSCTYATAQFQEGFRRRDHNGQSVSPQDDFPRFGIAHPPSKHSPPYAASRCAHFR